MARAGRQHAEGVRPIFVSFLGGNHGVAIGVLADAGGLTMDFSQFTGETQPVPQVALASSAGETCNRQLLPEDLRGCQRRVKKSDGKC